ncbi:7,8-didemethyl-8-hydroxy-5-deazariboflavin synthase subunit CofH [Cyanobacterium sp. IPPAS B-1200]|uniref:7,8-didemethyl-8-hydroxy-5-deazariboflavin synthase subunit CofH n=1 Tax=Cyanobacterium sp. IPPAS B-1200 TaxID=1562720 RepID=UPI0008526972|nr:7,8-didemethyl-8-hydroxy-5-deazariboflavin synthase subunit CofH [Cyanobacterium sp. IPPAS B-1200]OEJ77403.1 7,8-didemethyl-8-hydroxy-5-deazariboflavin synthase subunit CofH [Cyanobacterium sp. IPPAS B-1200]
MSNEIYLTYTKEQLLNILRNYQNSSLEELRKEADNLRKKQVGDRVTYVVNRNINFTNICEQHCSFCAFRKDEGQIGAFWLDIETILGKCQDAMDVGATEICMQGGLNPQAQIQGSSLKYYLELIKGIKTEFPQLHLHGFSPQEIEFIARQDNLTFRDVIITFRDHGLGSMPGTAAEILDDKVRKIICPEKINTFVWMEIISTAHSLGVPTTSTMLCGHIETPEQQLDHLFKVRSLQETAIVNDYPAKITEFILLPFVGEEAPKPLRNRVGRNQPDLLATLVLTAVSRIVLGDVIINHQPSWVKLGLEGALQALQWGCNDIGGTLMEEHITTMAGAKGGTCLDVATIQKAITSINRPYGQRNTLYEN